MTLPQGRRPLAGVRVLDFSRLSPGPYGTMLLADLGADVISVLGGRASPPRHTLMRGKRVIEVDLREATAREAVREAVRTCDVVVEAFRPGVAARLGIDFATLSGERPDLVYCSLTGYGQEGPLAMEAGHDLNYLALSGLLGAMGPAEGPPVPPLNLVGDAAAGGLALAFAVTSSLFDRNRTGQGCYVDLSIVDGILSLMADWGPEWQGPLLPSRGRGIPTGDAPFYRCYACSDGRFVAVGAVEPQFFAALCAALGLPDEQIPADHMDPLCWPELAASFTEIFGKRPRDEWEKLSGDCCVTPVLEPHEVPDHPYMALRHPRFKDRGAPILAGAVDHGRAEDPPAESTDHSSDTASVLLELGVDPDLVGRLQPR